ncbi:long-chain fatty acid--CoA ligase [Cytobacillus sp. S13-E01]|uniref:long-chain fatty acid--CoA ligase n=1 Tax=Cytobacillus sp. S13-E01 TaxID=3031326 RepID=UPI0023D7CB70|nr:long-chain fatty acid--CoA ligase [Cytobacillus sp. S13-E01]MDF0725409.1 long-chain fatty acid--CoA ligase [Cytobacillus sp. S13-E01]
MNQNHFEFWPKRLSKTLTVPKTTLFDNFEVSARRYPSKEALNYYGTTITYSELYEDVISLAGYLEHKMGVKAGEHVLLFMQNSPQFIIAFHAIIRLRAVVVPINPMNTSEELAFYVKDCAVKHALVGQELFERVEPLLTTTPLKDVIVAAYSDYVGTSEQDGSLPQEVSCPRLTFAQSTYFVWNDCLDARYVPRENKGKSTDIAVLPYTSGTTGLPKGCIHTNETVQANVVSAYHWMNGTSDAVCLMTLPLFHVTGMVHSMLAPIYSGATVVVMTRWDREYAAKIIEHTKTTHWVNISTMLIDFLSNPTLSNYDISSLSGISGGGAPLPEAVGEKLFNLTGLRFVEGYGLSETISQTHFNPPDRPKLQCLGIPSFDVDARIIDPVSLVEVDTGEIGEIVVNGPQLFKGYYNREDENRSSFMKIGGKRFFRTGDIARVDEEGYFFIVDRVKRMINASGYKVWPTEVESLLYKHPAVQQACVVGVPDERRGETVKAFIILQTNYEGKIAEQEIIAWSKEQMAAYKYPRNIEFKKTFPTTSSGKILWRKLQEEELTKIKG